jgi:hypothetical protein
MRKIYSYLLVFILGIFLTFLYFNKESKKNENEQIQVMINEVKNVSKLIVIESSFSQMYNYEHSKYFLFEPLSFDKKLMLLVNAKIQISYDLSKMKIETDTINKKVIINEIPNPEVFIAPSISYFDFEQSSFNTFNKTELNKINKKSIAKIKESTDIANLKTKAKKQLIIELRKVYKMTTLLDWTFIDNTSFNIIPKEFKD